MPPLKVNFYAALRKISGAKTVEFSFVEGLTIQKLLEVVVTRYPEMHDKLYERDGKLSRRAHIVINGRYSHTLNEGLDSMLSASDTVDIFPIGHF